jgi:hypothetical protein
MSWLRRLFHKSHSESQLDKELRFHLEQQIADNIAAGSSPEKARRRAQQEFVLCKCRPVLLARRSLAAVFASRGAKQRHHARRPLPVIALVVLRRLFRPPRLEVNSD